MFMDYAQPLVYLVCFSQPSIIMFPLYQRTPIHIHYHQQLYMKNPISQYKGRRNSLNNESSSIHGKHQVSYLANFTNRQHLRVPTEFLARAGRARPHTSCQPYSSTEPRLPLHDGRATSPESPSVSCCTTGGRLTRDTSAFLLPRRAGDLPETPRVTPNGGCLPYPRPHPRTEPCAYRVCLPKSGCIYARASFATCSTTWHLFLDHRMLMFE